VRLSAERAVGALARPYLGRLIGAGLLAAGTELAGLALMATATWLLITAAGRPPLDALTVAIVAVRALAISRGVLRYTERLAGHDAVLRIVTEVRARVFATLAVPAARPEEGAARPEEGAARPGGSGEGPAAGRPRAVEEHSGDTLSRLVSDVETVQDLLLRVLVPGAAAGGVALLAVAGTATVAPAAAGMLALGLLVAGIGLPALATVLISRTADRVAPLRGALAADAVDLTHGAADLAAFGATGAALDSAAGRARELARLERRLATAGWAIDALGVLVSGATTAAVAAVALRAGVDGVLVGVLAVGTLAAVEMALGLVGAARQWAGLRAGLARVAALLPSATERDGPADNERVDDEPAGPAGGVDFRLTRVVVRYRAGAPPALDRISLRLPPGRRTAVVGPSGAGKSTLVGVLTGAVRPASGQVCLDGIDIDRYPPRRLPRAVSGLLAEAHVFHATVRDNLLVGRADAGEEELTAAAAATGLLDWVRRQPLGWETVVGEDGDQLSGGQRQRLALARALLAAPAVLLLDEPTEGLDPAAADRVLGAVIDTLPADRSLVLVTHRLRGLQACDEILVLNAGQIVQRGRHADLVRVEGWYREQWLLQEIAERGYSALTT
jgi:ATP-binding cassette subfamily C protein CydC